MIITGLFSANSYWNSHLFYNAKNYILWSLVEVANIFHFKVIVSPARPCGRIWAVFSLSFDGNGTLCDTAPSRDISSIISVSLLNALRSHLRGTMRENKTPNFPAKSLCIESQVSDIISADSQLLNHCLSSFVTISTLTTTRRCQPSMPLLLTGKPRLRRQFLSWRTFPTKLGKAWRWLGLRERPPWTIKRSPKLRRLLATWTTL